ncbi:zygote specific ZYS1 isoform A [Micractinium conductrix]|uniref:Zygote specific ZYS1 isoform A n=1 Tax=Micractinium conductrix TaxID=554055 RepID=A0A2P6V9L9_9CHLO|nr:zygote specific ZYS1 isoform A [Micractinium conductrix]|eukprot:PSC70780.1 zygote specific ZYS1 isoform A [Micractinium conductrix]
MEVEGDKRRGATAITAFSSTMVERSAASTSSSEDTPVCWICLDTAGPLIFPCKCPRVAHPRCLARWQLQSAGSRKETHCEFCDARLPDWKATLTPQCGANAPAVMNVNFDGRTYSFEVKPGPDGYRQFTESIRRAFNLPDDSELNITFTCDEPSTGGPLLQGSGVPDDNGSLLTLQGSGAYDAAVHCASVSAARRLSSPTISRTVSTAEEYAASQPGTPMMGAPLGGAAGASPEGLSPEGGSAADAGLNGNKRRLSGSLRRLRSALQEFANALSSSSGGGGGGGMRP